MEKYKKIKEFPNYGVSRCGSIINLTTKVIKSQYVGTTGYYMVTLHHKNNGKPRRVHRLIAEAYIDNKKLKPCVNHIDGNKLNNSIKNLEWCTHDENMKHAFKVGLVNNTGERNGKSKLCKEQVLEIKERLRNGESQQSISNDFNVSRSCILGINTGRLWRHV